MSHQDDLAHDDLDLLRRAFTTTYPSDTPGTDCPSDDEIWQAASDELSPPRLREVIQHLATCGPCTEAWRVAQHLEAVPVGNVSAGKAWARGLAAAAAAALVVMVGPLAYRVEREPTSAPIERAAASSELHLLTEGSLPRENCVLSWRGTEEMQYYKLRVIDAANPLSKPLVDLPRITASEYRIAPEHLAHLPAGAKLLVHIEASSSGGLRIANDVFNVQLE